MTMIEVRRDGDGELLGFVEPAPAGGWRALTVFGAELSTVPDRLAAVAAVEAAGLAVLAERWWYRDGEKWLPVVIQEAAPGRVTAVVGDGTRFVNAAGRADVPLPITLIGADAAALSRRPG
jgi:hypothetical protein